MATAATDPVRTKVSIVQALLHRATNYDDPNSLGSRFRRRRAAHLLGVIDAIHARKGAVSILDIGGRPAYWNLIPETVLRARGCRIHLVNIEELDAGDGIFTAAPGDGRALDFADGSFDLVHANSVIEHVGTWQDMVAFAGEVDRLAPAYFIQTPAFGFPIEPHYGLPLVHWLPPQMRVGLLQKMPLGRWDRERDAGKATRVIEDSALLTKAQFGALFPDGEIRIERLAGLAKSYTVIRQ